MIMALLAAVSEELNVSVDRLIKDVARGETTALAELYKICGKAVYSYALSMTRNSYDAEDVLHETFLSLCRSSGEYTSRGKAMAYIFTITRNHCLKLMEKDGRKSDVPEDEFLLYISEAESISTEDKLIIEQCMKGLDDTERRLVVMHVLWGFKHREMAELLGLGLSTVISKYNRALKKLKNTLTESEDVK